MDFISGTNQWESDLKPLESHLLVQDVLHFRRVTFWSFQLMFSFAWLTSANMADMEILHNMVFISVYVLFCVAREHPSPNFPNQPLAAYVEISTHVGRNFHLKCLESEAIQTSQLLLRSPIKQTFKIPRRRHDLL